MSPVPSGTSLFFSFVLFLATPHLHPALHPLKLLPGCSRTKESPSAGFEDGVVGVGGE